MRQMEDPPPAPERSRRRPPRSRTTDPVPIPIPPVASRRGKTVRLQDVMNAYQQALIDAVEARLAAASQAAAQTARRAVVEAMSERPPGPDGEEPVREQLRELSEAVAAVAAGHDALGDEVGRKIGHGVVGVARVIRQDLANLGSDVADLAKRIEGLETSVRSLHRTLAWEGMRTPRVGGPAPPSNG
jgi:hypothetical protein